MPRVSGSSSREPKDVPGYRAENMLRSGHISSMERESGQLEARKFGKSKSRWGPGALNRESIITTPRFRPSSI